MGRQVVRGRISGLRGEGTQAEIGGDRYLDRLLKLIPAETVAVYLFIDGVLRSSLSDQPGQLRFWLWIMFAAIGVGNLFYLKNLLHIRHSIQYLIHTVAYVVWVLTIGGPFATHSWYQPFMGSTMLALFTFIIPQLYKGTIPQNP